jgi:hypothetical protein
MPEKFELLPSDFVVGFEKMLNLLKEMRGNVF